MATFLKPLLGFVGLPFLLAACQSIETYRLKNIKETTATQSNALIYCAEAPVCEFERINQTPVIDSVYGVLTQQAKRQNIVRLQPQKLNPANSIYLSVPSGQHELVVRFYPISRDKAEVLHLFHRFNAQQKYTVKMYRQRNTTSTRLLQVSVPDPLCVDLLQGQKTIRRFCKPYNVQTGIAEFVEQKI